MKVFTGIRNELHQVLDKQIDIRHNKIEQDALDESDFAYYALWDEITDLLTLKEVIGRWLREFQSSTQTMKEDP